MMHVRLRVGFLFCGSVVGVRVEGDMVLVFVLVLCVVVLWGLEWGDIWFWCALL